MVRQFDLIAGPQTAVPLSEGVADERLQPWRDLVTESQTDLGDDLEPVPDAFG